MNTELIQNQPDPKSYLGDGCYIRYDGYNFILTTENGVEVSNVICLEPEVVSALKGFIESVTKPVTPTEIPESIQPLISSQRNEAKKHNAVADWMARNSAALASLKEHGIRPSFWGYSVDFDYLSHDKVIKVIQAFPGKWTKELNYVSGDKIDYSSKFDGMDVKCGSGEPPPSCRIIEEEVEVPARKEKRRRLECTPAIAEPASSPILF